MDNVMTRLLNIKSDWLEYEISIILNTIHLAISLYYIIYEILALVFAKFGYPKLPTVHIPYIVVGLSVIGALLGFLGSASWKLRYLLASNLVSLPLAAYDIFLFALGRFQNINVEDFLLFQGLFTTTFKVVRIISMSFNLGLLIYFVTSLPESVSFWDYV